MPQQIKRKKSFLVNFVNRANDKGVKNNPKHFIFFDTETDQEFKTVEIGHKTLHHDNHYKICNNTLQMGWACYWNKEKDTEEWYYYETVKDFQLWLYSIILKTKKQALWIIAHNINFDNTILDINKYLKEQKFESTFIHTKGMVHLQKLVKYKKKKVKKIVDGVEKEEEQKKSDKVIMLVNNGNIFPATLKTIGKVVNLPKLEVDFEQDSKEYVKIYCKRDVEILVAFWKLWTEFIDTYGLGKIKFTISSQSMEAYRKKFCNSYIVLDDDMDNLAFERLSYYGGRTEIFHKGKVRKPIFGWDVNSLYPSVMIDNRFPTEFKFSKRNPYPEDVKRYIDKGYLVIAECYLDTKYNCYPVKEDNTLKFPVGKIHTYLATPEVLEAFKNNDIVKFGRVSFYKGENIFHDYIEFFYNERLKKKKEGSPLEKMLKLFLNSLYGKFGMMNDNFENTTEEYIRENYDNNFDFDSWIMDEYQVPELGAMGINLMPHLRYIGETLQISCEKTESNISFPAIASHVTSYARMILWQVIKACQESNIKYYYCDTDSLFTESPIPDKFIDEHILGKLKLEHYYCKGAEFINLKNYCRLDVYGNKIVQLDNGDMITINDDEKFPIESKIIKGSLWKLKGVPNGSQMLDINTFIVQEWGGLPKQEYYRKYGRKPGEFWVVYKKKKNRNVIKKGQLNENGDIEPFVFNDF